jgi:sulfate permease, SulP family
LQEEEKSNRWKALFPAAEWLPAYQLRWLRSDVVAGITLAAYAILQSRVVPQLAAELDPA